MPSNEFETLISNDELIIVRDIETKYVFTMPVVTTDHGDRILGLGSYVPNAQAKVRAEDIAQRVWNYAQMEMKLAGHVKPRSA